MGKKRSGRLREFQREQGSITIEEAQRLRAERREQNVERNRQIKARRKARLSLPRVLVLVLAIFIVVAIGTTVKNIVSLQVERSQLLSQQEALIQEKEDLKEELKNITSDEYIERQARDLLKMVKPTDKIFIIEDGNED
ncbi:MAG: septum formation initiator family protein [Clostridia bacterium]|nr:septum formation initiator family protein [Clostridia bacterium]